MASVASGNPRPWRFTWEALAHIPTLRLYLFRAGFDPSARCSTLRASLRFDESVLLVSWTDEEEGNRDVSLRVPVPRVLIDPGCPVDCTAKSDHIAIKLVLVLPVDHPVVANCRGVIDSAGEEVGDRSPDRLLPLSLDSDIGKLSAEGVHFFCKACLTKLTRQPLRCFVEMPSVNWREVADNWFGACCCSFGGISEKLVSQYINSYNCAEGTCLVDAASVIICKDDLQDYTFQQCSEENSEWKKSDLMENSVADALKEGTCGNLCEDIPHCAAHKPAVAPTSFSKETTYLAQPSLDETHSARDVDLLKLNLKQCSDIHGNPLPAFVEGTSKDHCHCCEDKTNFLLNFHHGRSALGVSIAPTKSQIDNSHLGGGFMTRTSNLLNDMEWIEFSCRNCLSPLGSYPYSKSKNVLADGGIRLFKCYISTCVPAGGPHDIFRKHTLQRVFVHLLLESAEDELSFRTVVKDMRTKYPMLQLVLLSSKAWCSSSCCSENVKKGPFHASDLQPVVKVLFSECSTASEVSSRQIEDWSTRNHAEELYMMTHPIEELTKYLNSAVDKLPPSCSSLQGMYLSTLER
ncbi:uncharacterized protein [Elaeis guineensis]|uniref:uncharacterized protein isoform X2 n=1 Tax=Elaeis guineensis var. tenera TaxID=51953 RepID=UPI003C6D82F1